MATASELVRSSGSGGGPAAAVLAAAAAAAAALSLWKSGYPVNRLRALAAGAEHPP